MDLHTLQDLAEYCYQKWLTTDNISLPSGAIEWIREDLGEQSISEKVRQIFEASIQWSEKCYRFLKLTGVIDRNRLRKLLKKQVLDEIENERDFKLKNLKIDFQNKVNEQRRRLLSNPNDEGLHTGWLMLIAALVVGGIGILVGSKIGWSIGVLVGAGATVIYRMTRMSELIGQFVREAQPGLDIQRQSIGSVISDKETHIDEAVINLEQIYSGPLINNVNNVKESSKLSDTVAAPDTIRDLMWPAALVLFLMIVPGVLFGINYISGMDNSVNIEKAVVAVDADENSVAIGIDTSFPPGPKTLHYNVTYNGAIANQTVFSFKWFKSGILIKESLFTAKYPSGWIDNKLNYNFQPGQYEVLLSVDNQSLKTPFAIKDKQDNISEDSANIEKEVVIVHAGVAEKLSSNNEPIGEATVFYGNARYDRTSRDHVTYFAKFSGAVPDRTRFSAKVFYNGKEALYTHHCDSIVVKVKDGTYSCRTGPYYLRSGNWEIRLFADKQEINRTQFTVVESNKQNNLQQGNSFSPKEKEYERQYNAQNRMQKRQEKQSGQEIDTTGF